MNRGDWIIDNKFSFGISGGSLVFDRPVLLLGAGEGGIEALTVMKHNSEQILGFVDSDTKRQGTEISGLPVYLPFEIAGFKDDIILVISSMHVDEISKVLCGMDFFFGKDFIPIEEYMRAFQPAGEYAPDVYVKKAIHVLKTNRY